MTGKDVDILYELWDTDADTVIGEFTSAEELFAAEEKALHTFGNEYMQHWVSLKIENGEVRWLHSWSMDGITAH